MNPREPELSSLFLPLFIIGLLILILVGLVSTGTLEKLDGPGFAAKQTEVRR